MEYVFHTVGISKKFIVNYVLRDINLHVPKGSIYGLVGPNGSGKSTLIRILLGSIMPTDGYFAINGKTEENEIEKEKKNIGSIIESPTLYANMSAIDNLICHCMALGVENPREKSLEILKKVNLEDTHRKKVKNFSLGMKQRLALGLALLSEPKILVLDEPTNGLDPIGISQMRDLLTSLNDQGVTILISSHILSELSKFATHYGILYNGKLVKEISAEEVLNISHEEISIRFNTEEDAQNALKLFLTVFSEEDIRATEKCVLNVSTKKVAITTAEISRMLLDNNIVFSAISVEKVDFEEYFLKIVNEGRV